MKRPHARGTGTRKAGRREPPPAQFSDLLSASLAAAVRDFQRRLKRCRRHRDAESIHQLRVQSRRLAVCCDLLDALGGGAPVSKARRRVKKLLRSLARLRDTQVQQDLFRSVPARLDSAAKILRRGLRREEPRWARRVTERCRRVRAADLDPLLLNTRHLGALSGRTESAAERGLETAIEKWLEQLDAEARRRLKLVRASRPESLHRFRIAVKHLRYGHEAVASVLPGKPDGTLRRLRSLQGKLGEIQDLEMGRARIEAAAAAHRRAGKKLNPLRLWLVRQRDGRIRRLLENRSRLRAALTVSYSTRKKATRSDFSSPLRRVPRTRLKNSTVSSRVNRRSS